MRSSCKKNIWTKNLNFYVRFKCFCCLFLYLYRLLCFYYIYEWFLIISYYILDFSIYGHGNFSFALSMRFWFIFIRILPFFLSLSVSALLSKIWFFFIFFCCSLRFYRLCMGMIFFLMLWISLLIRA